MTTNQSFVLQTMRFAASFAPGSICSSWAAISIFAPTIWMLLMASSDQVDAAESCVICFGSLVRNPVVRVDSFRLLLCQACGSWTAMPRPDAVVQHAFHDSDIYFEHPYLAHRRANPALVTRRCAAIFSRIGRVLDLAAIRGEPVMDVGCDTGEFILSAARQFGIRP